MIHIARFNDKDTCPVCGSKNTDIKCSYYDDEDKFINEMFCNDVDCKTEWKVILKYGFIGIEDIDVPTAERYLSEYEVKKACEDLKSINRKDD